MRFTHLFTHLGPAAALVATLLLSPLRAATPGSGAPPTLEGATLVSRDPVETSRYLGTVFKKETEGFRITPPAGSRIIERSGIDLMSFVVDAKSWGGSVQQITLAKFMTLDDYVKTTKAELTGPKSSFKGVQVLDERILLKDKYPSVRISFSMDADLGPAIPPAMQERMGLAPNAASRPRENTPDVRVSLFRQEIISRVKDNQFLVLTMYAPLKDKAEATKTFEMMLNEYELFDPATLRQRRGDAIKLGQDWLKKQSAEQFIAKIQNEPAYFRILVGAKDVGYIRFDEGTQEPNPKGSGMIDVERDGHKGVLLRVNFRSFPEDGSVVYGQNEAFWCRSQDGKGNRLPDYSSWINITKTKATVAVPLNQVRPGQPSVQVVTPWIQETGVITQFGALYQLLVTLTGDAGQRLPEGVNRVIPQGEAVPLPMILEYSWTRFVDLTKPSEMTFVVFDPASKKLSLRNLIVTGTQESVTIDGKPVTCYKCIDEVDPNSTTIWTDKTGRIQMMRTSDQSVMIPSTEAAITAKWASRLKEQ